jgi:hypothetical protein
MKKRMKKLSWSCLLLFQTVTLTLILREEGSRAFAKVKELLGLLLLSGGDSEKHIPANFPGASRIPVLVVLGCAAHSCRTISCLLLAGAENCFPLGSASRFPTPTIVQPSALWCLVSRTRTWRTNHWFHHVFASRVSAAHLSVSLCLPLYFSPHVPVRLETRFDAEGFISHHRDIDGFFWIEIERGSPLVAHENCLVFSLQVSRTLFFCTLLFGNSIGRSCNFVVRFLL